MITVLDIARAITRTADRFAVHHTVTRGVDRLIGQYAQVYLTGTAGADVARDWRWKWERQAAA